MTNYTFNTNNGMIEYSGELIEAVVIDNTLLVHRMVKSVTEIDVGYCISALDNGLRISYGYRVFKSCDKAIEVAHKMVAYKNIQWAREVMFGFSSEAVYAMQTIYATISESEFEDTLVIPAAP